ncbi:MAG: MotA/TolQ/ExbB proton channel family protein [Desulfobacter sp.]|nr:MotA/TolQ/ExbB proton channel family protein [Desulfobacter sp.]WDP87921.1 MAG: MotA/TolQ/ExbB proton channel family protein [Desulfobacter sp.]
MTQNSKVDVWTHGKQNIIGVVFCFLLFCLGFFFSGNIGLYLNLAGLIIVVGGTCTAVLLGFRMERVKILFKVISASYTRPAVDSDTIVKILVDLSIKRKIKGILSLEKEEEETTIFFLRRAIGLMVDNYTPEQIRESLNAEMYFFRKRRDENLRLLQTMADVAPAFGLVGSVVGLIGMLGGIGDSATLMATIPIALTSTLYGVILANMICYPIAANIRERTSQELLLQRIITEGVVSIASDIHPRVLDKKLKSFLTPSARKEEVISIARIKEHLEKEELEIPPPVE